MAGLLLVLLPLACQGMDGLASFGQLQQAWLGSQATQDVIRSHGGPMADRTDRSLAGTYPFNHVAAQGVPGHHQATQTASHHQAGPATAHQQAIPAHHRAAPAHQQAIPAHHRAAPAHQQTIPAHQQAAPAHQQAIPTHHRAAPAPQQTIPAHHRAAPANHRAALAHRQAAPAHRQATPAHHRAAPANNRAALPAHHQATPAHHQAPPAASPHQTAGFSLQFGFGSRSQPRSQYQIGQALFSQAAPSVASLAYPTPTYQAYQAPAYQAPPPRAVAQAYNPAPGPGLPNIALAPSACPAIAGLPISQCAGAANSCWAVGQPDVDCPAHGLCCFDGCANSCQPAPHPHPAPLPAPFVEAVVVEAPPRRRIAVKRLRPKNPFQARQPLPATGFAEVAAARERCIDKIETVEEIEYDEVEQCDHSYDQKCHTTYVTEYESQQEEECEDNYKKSCDITYSPSALNVTVEVCSRPLVKDCNLSGPETCRTEYVSECWTRNEPHLVEDDVPHCETVQEERCVETTSGYTTQADCKNWPREVCTISREQRAKYNPVTKCEKVPRQLCGPSGCGFVPGPEICHPETKTVVTDIPQESCDLQPQRSCEHVTKLVPKLSPVEECVDVPKEVCTKARVNPRTVHKPITKKWCYVPSEESGLA